MHKGTGWTRLNRGRTALLLATGWGAGSAAQQRRARPRRLLGLRPSPLLGFLAATVLVGTGVAHAALPAPTGSAPVGTTTAELRDAGRDRPLMVSLWYPATREAMRHPRARYVSARLRAVFIRSGLGSMRSLTMRTNSREGARPRAGLLPVVLFSPGFGGPRVGYQVLAEDLASHGWLVVAVDHTGEVPIEFPHGKIVPATPGLNPFSDASVRTRRVGDLRFLLHRLSKHTNGVGAILRRLASGAMPARPDVHRVAVVGHSLGGASAASTMLAEPTIRAGINFDGLMFDRVVKAGLDRPFMLLDTPSGFGPQEEFYGHLRGHRLAVEVAGTAHLSFTDVPVVAPGFPLNGTIQGMRMVAIERTYVEAFLDSYVRGHRSPLVKAASGRFPEVEFLPGAR
jgi:predicted dienelactone hydrolase